MQDGVSELGPIRLARERPLRLGTVRVDPARRQIIREGVSETLEPRVMQVLVALAQANGQILGRDDLIARCWDGRVVGDNAIHRAVSKVRDLGLTFGAGDFKLETITKVGYRMIVRGAPEASISERMTSPPASGALQMPVHRRWALGGAAAAAAAAGGLALWARSPVTGDAPVEALIARSEQAMREGLPESDARGVGFLSEAVALQPGNVRAWGKLALAYCLMAEHSAPDRIATAVRGAQDAAARALALDRRQADALAALAILPPYFGAWFAAEQRFTSVLRVDSEHLPTRDARAFMLSAVGRGREGSTDRLTIAGREPLHAVHQFRLVYALWTLGRITEADQAADRAIQLWPQHPAIWFSRLWLRAFTGRADRALTHLEDAAARPTLPPLMVQTLRASLEALTTGRADTADTAATGLFRLVSQGPSHSINAVLILSALGRIDQAFEVAEAYLLERGPLMSSVRWNPGQLSVNDQYRRKTNMLFVGVTQPMRDDPRFAALTDAVGLSEYWLRAGVTPDHLQVRSPIR